MRPNLITLIPMATKRVDNGLDLELIGDTIVAQAAHILGPLDGQRILIAAGKGMTAALGLLAAVKLVSDGARPKILLGYEPDDLIEDAQFYLKQAKIIRIPLLQWTSHLPAGLYSSQDLIIDALLGASTKGSPRYPIDQIIGAINSSRVPVLSLDVPSGLDPKTGKPGKPTVVSLVTLQMSVPTERLLDKSGALFVGKVVKINHKRSFDT